MYPSLEEVKKIAASGEYRRIPVCRELTIRRTAEARIGAKTQEAEAGKTDATDASETVEVRKVTHPGEALREILKDYKSPVLEGLSPIYRRPGRLLLLRLHQIQ